MFPGSIPNSINVNLQRRDDCHPTGACCRAAGDIWADLILPRLIGAIMPETVNVV
jgi:hypothetical protein